jgi:hypothetical protein
MLDADHPPTRAEFVCNLVPRAITAAEGKVNEFSRAWRVATIDKNP